MARMGTPRRKSRVHAIWPAALVATLGGLVVAAPGQATITALPSQDAQFRKGATELAKALARNHRQVKRGRFAIIPPGGRPAAISTTKLAGFPRHGKSYAILSNGDARRAGNKNSSGEFGVGAGGPFVRGARDVLIFRIDLAVPKDTSCVSFAFRFLSEEFPEFVSSEFNDAFIAEEGSTSWTSRSNQDPVIDAPGNFAKDSGGRNISVNQAGAFTVSAANAKGTTYDGATPIIRASSPIKPGARSVYLSIFDQGDRNYDSAVFVDNLRLHANACSTGTVVEE
jgi:hypothetical protein